MSPAKVTLSPKELELVTDPSWILTKNGIIQKVYALFGDLSIAYAKAIEACDLYDKETILARSPKISKGEQYEGLPWVMLDQPRHYTTGEAFGIRTSFWWGNSFSITLQLAGRFKEIYTASIENYFSDKNLPGAPVIGHQSSVISPGAPVISHQSSVISPEGWLAGIGEDEWQHHFREDNYVPVETVRAKLAEHTFIKLTKRYPLGEWDNMEILLENSFMEILRMLEK